ncbi:extracellular tyrosine-protein kinase PKDCC-like [Oratosquilla oratoria]|uniref:extracellular tyrosine-protein kinase PKDCC-like n=1 Tax=Oratosquilla oratoria TaxID=337810 RepID=UPI003F759D48
MKCKPTSATCLIKFFIFLLCVSILFFLLALREWMYTRNPTAVKMGWNNGTGDVEKIHSPEFQKLIKGLDPKLCDRNVCEEILPMKTASYLSSGHHKSVYRVEVCGKTFALKTVHHEGPWQVECEKDRSECENELIVSIAREGWILSKLIHPNILKIFGTCFSDIAAQGEDSERIAVITELGIPYDLVPEQHKTTGFRLKMAHHVCQVLKYLASSPLGPLLMLDMKQQQFVLVHDHLKLSDMDDVVMGDPSCDQVEDCQREIHETVLSGECSAGICEGLNAMINTVTAGRTILRSLLIDGASLALQQVAKPLITDLIENRSNITDFINRLNEISSDISE